MKKKGNVLYDYRHPVTGTLHSFQKITTRVDGADLTDADLITHTLIKVNAEYFERIGGEPVATPGTVVKLDRNRDFGLPTPLPVFTVSFTGIVAGSVVSVYGSGFAARPAALTHANIRIATEPSAYDSTKELMVMLRVVNSTKVICTITQY